jgi:NAD(P)-dependent dehydrogenase (short-subunit alcohol dehydrogenase family)
MLLNGKNAIITGTNRGLGRSILEAFAANGAHIYAHARVETPEFLAFLDQLSKKYNVKITPRVYRGYLMGCINSVNAKVVRDRTDYGDYRGHAFIVECVGKTLELALKDMLWRMMDRGFEYINECYVNKEGHISLGRNSNDTFVFDGKWEEVK